jgi:predicted transcriptional regulator
MDIKRSNPILTARIVGSYVRHHMVGTGEIADLITSVHQALGQLGQPVQPEEVRGPAVSVRQSVRHEYVVCLDCGYSGKTLRRHITMRHGLSRDEYLKRWGLRSDHPLTAPAYSERRSTLAKELGLGRKPKTVAGPAVSPTAAPAAAVRSTAKVPADGDGTTPARRRRPGAASKSADVASEAAAATPAKRRGSRSRVAPPQPE